MPWEDLDRFSYPFIPHRRRLALRQVKGPDILQMDTGSKPNLTRFPFVDKMAWPIRRAKRLPGGPTRLGGLNGMVFFVIVTCH
jgi:hypothetical protein